MYALDTKLMQVKGIGEKLFAQLAAAEIVSVRDLLLQLPLRYEDRSHFTTIVAIPEGELVTIQAKVEKTGQFSRNGKNMQTATISDATGKLKLMWFNNRFILSNLKLGREYLFSGRYNAKYRNMTQPTVEAVKADTIHTGRLVPLYSSKVPLQQGSLRRVLKHILDNLAEVKDPIPGLLAASGSKLELPDFSTAIAQLHFPDEIEAVAQSRERLALEEFLTIMRTSEQIKGEWQGQRAGVVINLPAGFPEQLPLPTSIPFELTGAQKQATKEILSDLAKTTPMNRLLIGDVGSGKTVVAAIAAQEVIGSGFSVALVAPTRILAEQHAQTIATILPQLPLQLLTSQTASRASQNNKPTLYIGTHAVINRMKNLQPGLIIYDEQHRFGVRHRSKATELKKPAHILTMTATPIPRSLMLTIFSHLQVSYLDEMPAGRIPTATWLVSEKKRSSSYDWLATELQQNQSQALIICPFIDPSDHEAFEKVASATEKYQELQDYFARASAGAQTQAVAANLQPKIALLHGRQKKTEQDQIIADLYGGKIDILVTTPIVEVGVDLPQAAVMIIESAERFGLASLHQLRGRVGRAGQASYCLLFTSSTAETAGQRLQQFTQINNGRELAELDLANRGSGEIFGTIQSGFSQLQFASWTNLEMIGAAQQIYAQLPLDWQPIFTTGEKIELAEMPLAN